MKHITTPASRAARAVRSASRLAVFAIATAFAAIALDRADADAQQSGHVKVLEVGGDHACALTEAGGMICWGRNDLGQATADFSRADDDLRLGEDYSCLGNSCWGSESTYLSIGFGDVSARGYLPNRIGIDFACEHWQYSSSRSNTCRGSNVYGQHTNGVNSNALFGGWHTCILDTSDGALYCAGRNDSEQTNVPSGRYISADAGRTHTCAVTSGNRLRCWGDDTFGQSTPLGGSDYAEVSSNAFANFNCALTLEKKVRCWGDNRYKQLNVPASIAAPPPLVFTQTIDSINSRKGQPINPTILPPASGGTGRLTYNIAHSTSGERKKGPPTGLVFDKTTRQLNGRVFNDAGALSLYYSVSDTSGRTEEIEIGFAINGPVPAGYAPAITTPELGTLDSGLIRCSIISEESRPSRLWGQFESYTFHLASPAQVTIDLASEDFDAYLLLINGDAWVDDDGGQDTNSRLSVGLAPARYWIYVRSADQEGEGAYMLRISSPDFTAGNADANRSCYDDSVREGELDSASTGRIVARRLLDGKTEFAWQPEGGDRILPRSRYLPSDPPTGRWLNSSDIVVEGVNVGRINVQVDAETGRIEFAFTPAGRDRILPQSRYFPSDADPGRWLRSTLIEPGG